MNWRGYNEDVNNIREKATKLRLEGYSYNEISLKIGIAKSTLFSWLHDVVLPTEAMLRLRSRVAQGTLNGLVKRNKMQTVFAKERSERIKKEAQAMIGKISRSDLLLVGTILYWAEGYKRLKIIRGREVTAHAISLTNSDPDIISTFVSFLTEVLKIPTEKIVIEMRLFKHLDAEEATQYWMKVTGLARSQFKKPMYPISRASQGKRPFNRLPYGTVQVIVSDTQMFYRIIGFIDGIKEQLRWVNK